MNAVWITIAALGSFYMGYKVYAKFLAEKVFGVQPDRPTPAHELEDGTDYVPTDRKVLWGHHFTSIAGAAPIVGPAIGVIWGWVPAALWIVLGSIFMGAVHDFGALIVSVRHQGRSIGELTGSVVSKRSRLLFLLIILFLLWLVIAVFALIIGILFQHYPATVIPIWSQMLLAVFVGFGIYRLKWGVTVPGVVALGLIYFLIWLGTRYPVDLAALGVRPDRVLVTWIVIICLYALVASVLPVWVLLQPRDFINAEQLVVALIVLYGGLFLTRPQIVAPALQLHPAGAPPLLPFLCITIACGAISGFHSLVSSGTSSKQLNRESDGRLVGYGGMIAEGILAFVALMACAAGFASRQAWHEHYVSWGAATGLWQKIGAFVSGGQVFLASLHIPPAVAETFMAVVLVSFAMTTIDTATRLQRYVIAELVGSLKPLAPLGNKYAASLIAAGSALALALLKGGGQGGMVLWPVFGATNQLLAALALTVLTLWLIKTGRPCIYTLIPMIIMLLVTMSAMALKLRDFLTQEVGPDWLLAATSGAIMVLGGWLMVEALLAWARARGAKSAGTGAEPPAERS